MLEGTLGQDLHYSLERIYLEFCREQNLDLVSGSLVDPLGNREAQKTSSSVNINAVKDQHGL
jgi:hypothetical protein